MVVDLEVFQFGKEHTHRCPSESGSFLLLDYILSFFRLPFLFETVSNSVDDDDGDDDDGVIEVIKEGRSGAIRFSWA